MPTQLLADVHTFSGWELRPHERVLLVHGEPVRIGSRAFDLLLALIELQGRVVGKTELLDRVWPGLVVEENNLSVQIATLRKLLGAQAIVTAPGRGYRLAAVAADTSTPVLPASLPVVEGPALFGRAADVTALRALVGVAPLVTIVGTGGVGKTSLARSVLSGSSAVWRDGLHWIDLSPLQRGSPFMPLVAKALGIALDGFMAAPEDCAAPMSRLQALIAVDNCEHMLDEVARFIATALRLAPGVRWLATSQEPLHLQGEAIYRLEPLDLPSANSALGEALEGGALGMFAERARAADRHFEVTTGNLATAVEICRKLDGLPLALEMAAARVVTLGLQGVADQIGERLRLRAGARDVPSRQNTLLQTFEWSYGLLTPIEQCVFRRLEPFMGGFDMATARTVCRGPDGDAIDEWQVMDALSALVDKSLVHRHTDGSERFHLLESARDYARMQLNAAHEVEAGRRRHAQVVAEAFAPAAADFQRMRDAQWSARYLPERHNARAALTWAIDAREPIVLARLVAALALLDTHAQAQAEVVQCGVPLDVLAAAPRDERAQAYLGLGWAHSLDGHREVGAELVALALADFEAVGDVAGTYLALVRLIRLCESRPSQLEQARHLAERLHRIADGELPLRIWLTGTITSGFQHAGRTIARLEELHAVAQRAGFDALAAVCRTHITDELLIQGRFDEAAETAQALLQAHESHPRTHALMCHNLALALVQLGRVDAARSAMHAMLRALPSAAHMVVDLAALLAAREGKHVEAALMAGYSARIKRDRGLSSDPAEAGVVAETQRRMAEALGPERLAELTRTGATLSPADAVAMAFPA